MISIDPYFFNAIAQLVVTSVLLVIMIVLRKGVPQRALLLGVWLLSLSAVLHRIDEIGLYFGVDVFNRTAASVLSWIVIGILYYTFAQIWQRHAAFGRIAKKVKTSEWYSGALEQGSNALTEK